VAADTPFSLRLMTFCPIVALLSIYNDELRNGKILPSRGSVKIDDTDMSREMSPRRKYELKQRAEEMARTHLRITEAAIELHGTVGPARTSMSAIARRAGVERRTLYRHFPTEADLFAACSNHYFTAYPWPDLDSWRTIRHPGKRLERALDDLYAYYERTESMLSNVLRDAELVDFAREAVTPLHAYLTEAAELLTSGRSVRGRRRQLLRSALQHALAFSTWHSLTTSGIERSDAVKLVTALVEASTRAGPCSAGHPT
jgi:AcrR family transcriptional regulator